VRSSHTRVMRLTKGWLAAYARYLASLRETEQRNGLSALRQGLASGDVEPRDVFIHVDEATHRVLGAIRLVPIDSKLLVLTEWRGAPDPSFDVLSQLVGEARERARTLGATRVLTRINVDRFSEAYRGALVAMDFRRSGGRIEYRTPVTSLPVEGPSDLSWRTMREAGEDIVIETLRAAGGGGPDAIDGLDGEDPVSQLLHTRYEAVDPRVVQLGMLRGAPACVLVLRVDPRSGWSTVVYLGVRPAFRGRGLGRQAHRHAFSVIRALGGAVYHDGTSEASLAMIRLFEINGCVESERLEEWTWQAAP